DQHCHSEQTARTQGAGATVRRMRQVVWRRHGLGNIPSKAADTVQTGQLARQGKARGRLSVTGTVGSYAGQLVSAEIEQESPDRLHSGDRTVSRQYPKVDPDGLLEYSVVFTDRALNHMSQLFQQVMRDISSTLKQVYQAEAVVAVPG